ncbi:hypothetical protein [Candidatus Nitronereus thalassa]|uniref:Exonuclease n=1 Tax=Candidatus Nitronereus thalassa TaxID=3020898 RepID=A0ABU3K8K0_9BACT|nr:hypothetical protein [Candidatus Nitronereus thalassa]MDT7042682.1 hypothetical protein [Candidatus Nitronereus thalassa]
MKNELSNDKKSLIDVYFSADVETDGPIPGPYSMLSFALVFAGQFDGQEFHRPKNLTETFYCELKPISDHYESEALRVNKLDREMLMRKGEDPIKAMTSASRWVKKIANGNRPILVAYPLSFDWTWLYWYFVQFSSEGSPFNHSGCFDLKTAYAVKAGVPIAAAGRSNLENWLRSQLTHSHNALNDAKEQAEIFANLIEWEGRAVEFSKNPAR